MKRPFAIACLALAACGEQPVEAPPADEPEPGPVVACTAKARSCAEVLALFVSGNDANVSVACDEAAGSFTITATGLPSWDPEALGEGTPNTPAAQGWAGVFPLSPVCAGGASTDLVASRGEIGLAVDGVALYGPENAEGEDAYLAERETFDQCGGHADQRGTYHYHAEPSCLFGAGTDVDDTLEADGHGVVVGFLKDGFAIHASTTIATEPALDACNGHVSAERGYHYHATDVTFPYLAACYAGEVSATIARR